VNPQFDLAWDKPPHRYVPIAAFNHLHRHVLRA
jgi:hypothetical protein